MHTTRHLTETSEAYVQHVKDKLTALKKQYKNATYIIGGDFNLPDIDWDTNTVSNKCYPHSQPDKLNITQNLVFEQMVNFLTRQENTLDLVFTTHPGYKIGFKTLPHIGEKSDHDKAC